MIQEELNIPQEKIFCYSDSETVLWWLTKSPNALLPFVSNRVKKIKDFGYPFQYVNTAENPADIASRGCTPHELMSTLWTQGPKFLRLPNKKWKLPKVDFTKVNKLQEIKKHSVFTFATLSMTTGKGDQTQEFDLEDYFGSHDKLIRQIAILKTFVEIWKSKALLKQKVAPYDSHQTLAHLSFAREFWVKDAQQKHFSDEISALKKGKPIPQDQSCRRSTQS